MRVYQHTCNPVWASVVRLCAVHPMTALPNLAIPGPLYPEVCTPCMEYYTTHQSLYPRTNVPQDCVVWLYSAFRALIVNWGAVMVTCNLGA